MLPVRSQDHARYEGGNQGSTDSTGLTFTSNGNGTCTLSSIGACKDICVVIPATSPSGEKVTAIGSQAFYNCTTITVVQIPASVTSIGHLAFGGCTNLVYITVSTGNYSYKDIGGVLYTADAKTLVHYPAGSGASSVSIPANNDTEINARSWADGVIDLAARSEAELDERRRKLRLKIKLKEASRNEN